MHTRRWLIWVALLLFCPLLLAQKAPPADSSSPAVPDAATLKAIVHDQFGSGYILLPGFAPLVADFDGDGVADLAVAAKAANPLLNAVEFNYKVIDPYHSFFGYGNPKITMQFGADDPRQQGQVVLILHRAKEGDWHSAQAKAKFVIVGLPFVNLSVSEVRRRKKALAAIAAEEPDKITSVLYWNGKQYKYEPMGADAE